MADVLIPRLPLKEEVVAAHREAVVAVFLVPAPSQEVVVHKEVVVHVEVEEVAAKCHLSILLNL